MSVHSVALTAREREILQLCAEGKTAERIGEALGITKRTVDEHAAAAVRKLDAANRTHAVALAIIAGLISPPPRES